MKLQAFAAAMGMIILCTDFDRQAQGREDRWLRLIDAAEELFGKNGLVFGERGEPKLEALVDFHAKYSAEVLGRPISPQRVLIVKEAMRLLRKTSADRYKGDPRTSFFRAMRDIASNRALFLEFLRSGAPAEVIEDQLLVYIQRQDTRSYHEPVGLNPAQLDVPATEAPIRIVAGGVRLHSDRGTVGNCNGAIDSGETVVLTIPLKNVSSDPFRSTSVFLTSKDDFVVPEVAEVVYSGTTTVGGETVSFAPNTVVTPKDTFTFSISPECPDSHALSFELLAWDSDRGKFRIPFTVKVFRVGPLDFGESSIDDDIPGLSDGDDDGVMEPGETIEYVLRVKNAGKATVEDVEATLFTASDAFQFLDRMNRLKYARIPPGLEKPVSSSFVVKLQQADHAFQPKAMFRLMVSGKARGFRYSWVRTRIHPIGVTDTYWEEVIAKAKGLHTEGKYLPSLELLEDPRVAYRVQHDQYAKDLASEVARKRRAQDIAASQYDVEEYLVCRVCKGKKTCGMCKGRGTHSVKRKCYGCGGDGIASRRSRDHRGRINRINVHCSKCARTGYEFVRHLCDAKHCRRGRCGNCKGTGREGELVMRLLLGELVDHYPQSVLHERVAPGFAKTWSTKVTTEEGRRACMVRLCASPQPGEAGSRMTWSIRFGRRLWSARPRPWGPFKFLMGPFRLVVFRVPGQGLSSRGMREGYLDALLFLEPNDSQIREKQ